MPPKYAQIDQRFLDWLRSNRGRTDLTTAGCISDLAITCTTTQRHISRRFTFLEDRGILTCTLRGTTRICTVHPDKEIPSTMARQRWRPKNNSAIRELDAAALPKSTSIVAANSDEFLAAGGKIDTIPSNWNRKPIGSLPLGDSFSFDD